MLIHMPPVFLDIFQRGAGKGIAQRLLRLRADSVVIGIKEVAKARIKSCVSGKERRKYEGFKEAGCMRLMPLGRAGFRTRLNHLVFGGEWADERFCLAPHEGVSAGERIRAWFLVPGRKADDRLGMGHDRVQVNPFGVEKYYSHGGQISPQRQGTERRAPKRPPT